MPGKFASLVLGCLLTVITSCSSKPKNDSEVFKAIEESVRNSNNMIAVYNKEICLALKDKISDLSTSAKARIWYPRAKRIEVLVESMMAYLQGLKDKLLRDGKLESKKTIELYKELNEFKDEVLSIDSNININFKNSLIVVTREFDSTQKSAINFDELFFKDKQTNAAMAMLDKVQNNIRIIANKLLNYCNNHCSSFIENYTTYSAIVGQSSSIVKKGETIEITAGMGAFSRSAMPEISIYGRSMPLDESGVLIYKFVASHKPGTYYVPVSISFINQDGIRQKISKDISYTIMQ